MENDKDFAFMVRGEPGDMNGGRGPRDGPRLEDIAKEADKNQDKMISYDELRYFG
jgi:hypothetical protein